VTEIVEMADRGQALVIDGGWRDVADVALSFVQRFVSAEGTTHPTLAPQRTSDSRSEGAS
jgi:hypothetical protein